MPFHVRACQIRRGRRVAVHEYPWNDTIWVEDLGRGRRGYGFAGFLLGETVVIQQAIMLEAAELPGPGLLIHPALGSILASLVGFAADMDVEDGGLCKLTFEFLESAPGPLFPGTALSTPDQTNAAADSGQTAIAQDFGQTSLSPTQLHP